VQPLLLKANALQMLERVEEAVNVFKMVLHLRPDCVEAEEGIRVCQEKGEGF
jgi:hypothetical protein